MKNKPKISIIIPFYNATPLLELSIKSVLKQDFKDYEVILVNDGSTDDSKKIVNSYSVTFQNIHLINISNSGPGIARNKGIEKASGKFLLFLDADDQLHENALYNLYNCIKNTDLCIGRHEMLNTKQQILKTSICFKQQKTSNTEAVLAVLTNRIIPTSWAKLYKTEIAKTVLFPDLRWKEDDVFLLTYLNKIKTVSYSNKIIVKNYCKPDSLTRQPISNKMIMDIFTSFDLQEKLVHPDLKYLIYNQKVASLTDLFLIFYIDQENISHNKNNIINQLKKQSKAIQFKGLKGKKKLLLFLLKLSAYLGIFPVLQILSVVKKNKINRLKEIKN